MIKDPTIDLDDGKGGIFPHSSVEYELEVMDCLGHWCRLRGSSVTLELMNARLIQLYGDRIPWDEIRIIIVDKTEHMLNLDVLKPKKKKK